MNKFDSLYKQVVNEENTIEILPQLENGNYKNELKDLAKEFVKIYIKHKEPSLKMNILMSAKRHYIENPEVSKKVKNLVSETGLNTDELFNEILHYLL